MPVQSRDKDSILWNHYLWCVREGRDTSWWFRDQATRKSSSTVKIEGRPVAKGSSFKPEDARSKIREPEYKR